MPALPGSRTWASTTTIRGDAARTSSRSNGRKSQTASTPCGVVVSPACASSSVVDARPRGCRPRAPARPISGWRSRKRRVHHRRRTTTGGRSPAGRRHGAPRAPPAVPRRRTGTARPGPHGRRAAGPPAARRHRGLVPLRRLTAHRHRADGSPASATRRPVAQPRGQAAACAAGSASLAVCTRATKATSSLTARSARILRSTSTPAALSPWIRRL